MLYFGFGIPSTRPFKQGNFEYHTLFVRAFDSYLPCGAKLRPMTEERKHSFGFWLLVSGGIFAVFLAVVSLIIFATVRSIAGDTQFAALSGDSIGVVDIDGVILSSDTVVDQIRKFEQDNSIK